MRIVGRIVSGRFTGLCSGLPEAGDEMSDVHRHEWDVIPGNPHFPDVLIKDSGGVIMWPYHIVSERRGSELISVSVTGHQIVDGKMNDKVSHVWHWDNESGRTLPPDLYAIVR
jgi:hypothetical protein